ncbi:MAG: PstS family phosphate ABC transporter substrate-binding protein [Candidatus Thermoplasmatota archaeon]|nr:PstS family phosphate ABC transporter substrate-binding protein [Candidatus Thermoplasmatota archaeon]
MKGYRKYITGGIAVFAVALMAIVAGCLEGSSGKENLIQTGSSTVLPLATKWAEEYDGANIAVSGGGSSHGLNALLNGEADLGDASRLMKGSDYEKVGGNAGDVNSDGTAKKAAPTGVWPYKWVVAYDVLATVVNNDNTWATELTFDQLYHIFTTDNTAIYWDDPILNLTGAPHEKIEIYAPDEASGTYDYFFESLISDWGKDTRTVKTRLEAGDGVYHPSADDNVIMNAIKANKNAIGFFGFAYLIENPNVVKPVKIAETDTFVEPSFATVSTYPMARPLFIYTNGIPKQDNDKGKAIYEYLEFILSEEGQRMVPEVGYVRLSLVDPSLAANQLADLKA